MYNVFKNKDFHNKISCTLANNISWSFIPPRSPNFGGLLEAGIKSVKYHIGETILTYEEMYTILTRIKAGLYSRPLFPISNDPNDLNALTPSHLLIEGVLTAPLEHDLTEIKVNRLSRWQLIQQLRQHFWKRWQREYVSQLQQRTKWKSATKTIQPGNLVILVEENLAPLCWSLGRVQETYPGKDGVVRVINIKTNKGTYIRTVSKVYVLPISDQCPYAQNLL
jgi:hypothetical protein